MVGVEIIVFQMDGSGNIWIKVTTQDVPALNYIYDEIQTEFYV